jgi:hypothetical protein
MTTMVEDTCRFCFEGPEPANPLVNPCKCTGSMKYIHVQCIRLWRTNTTNYEWINRCQLCLSDYDVFLRWAKESAPRYFPLMYIITDKHYLVSMVMFYLHMITLSIMPIIGIGNNNQKSAFLNLETLYFTQISYWLYVCLLVSVTYFYIMAYYKSFWKHIQNKKLYTYLWLGCISNSGIFQTPLMTICMTVISGMISVAFISPFAFVYIYMLSSIYEVHLSIIRHINDNAEIF